MDTTIDNIQLKRAWQTAFELRLCPDGDTLFAEPPDENLRKHLAICHVCREKRVLPFAQRAAWEELQRRFAGPRHKPERPERPVAGQIWSLKQNLSVWGKDGYFYKPPKVLLLERIEESRGFMSVQLYSDRLLMGEGDVWLDDRFGFAQGWNCYSLHEEALDGCWGTVDAKVLEQVHEAVAMKHAPVEEDSILYFFRRVEINVGAKVALPSVAVLVEEWETAAAEEVLCRQEICKGLLLTAKEAGETVLTIAHDALVNIMNNLTFDSFSTMEPARSAELTRTDHASKTEITRLADIVNNREIPFIPCDIYSSGDNTYISLYKINSEKSKPKLVITCQGNIIDRSKIDLEDWTTKHPTIVIRDHWISISEIRHADPLFEIEFKGRKVQIDILPE